MNPRALLRRAIPAILVAGAAIALIAPPSSATSLSHGRLLATSLSGAEEVPANASTGRGFAVVKVDARKARVCYAVAVTRLSSTVVASHIHKALKGVNGPIVVNFDPPVDGFSAACVAVDPALATDIAANPSGYYVNVHTETVRSGEVRGQLGR